MPNTICSNGLNGSIGFGTNLLGKPQHVQRFKRPSLPGGGFSNWTRSWPEPPSTVVWHGNAGRFFYFFFSPASLFCISLCALKTSLPISETCRAPSRSSASFFSPLSLSSMQEVFTPLMETTAQETHRPRHCRSTASMRLQWVTCERLEILSKSHEWNESQ